MSIGKNNSLQGTPQQGKMAGILQCLADYWIVILILVLVAFFLGWFARGLFGS